MDFSDLKLEDDEIIEVKKTSKINLDLKKIEPGYKVPVANYIQIGTWCERCGDVRTHAFNSSTKNLRCLCCKTTRLTK